MRMLKRRRADNRKAWAALIAAGAVLFLARHTLRDLFRYIRISRM